MPKTLGDLLLDVEELSLGDVTEQVLEDQADIILDRNKAQLYRGETSTGGILPPYKWEEYALLKHSMNPLPGFGYADHKLTGAYYNAFVATIDEGILHITSHDSKANKLEERAGDGDAQAGADESYGLGEEEHNSYIAQDFQPSFYETIHRDLKLIQ